MRIIKWSAIGVTALMGLANFGQVGQSIAVGWKVLGLVLALAAIIAVVGFASGRSWGRSATIGIGAVNLVGALVGAVAGVEGWPIGLVLAALGIVLAAVYTPAFRSAVTA